MIFQIKKSRARKTVSSCVGDCHLFYRCNFSVLSVVPLFTEAELHLNGGGNFALWWLEEEFS